MCSFVARCVNFFDVRLPARCAYQLNRIMAVTRGAARRIVLSLWAGCIVAQCLSSDAATAQDRTAMMRLTAEHWLQSQRPDGSLPYGFDFLADKTTAPNGSNWAYIVRQAASTSAWAQYYAYAGERRLQEPIARALAALGTRSLPIRKSGAQHWIEQTRILSMPVGRWRLNHTLNRFGLLYESEGTGRVVSPDGKYGTARTGATGVALLAESAYSRASGDDRFAGLRSAWVDGLTSLRIPGGGFRETPTSIDESDYSNGEAWLALATHCEYHRKDARCAILDDLDRTLLARYSGKPNAQFYHWGAMAAAQRYRTTGESRFFAFLERQADFFLRAIAPQLDASWNNCAAMEGVTATLIALDRAGRHASPVAERLRTWLSAELAKLPRLQIRPQQTRIELGGDAHLDAPRLVNFSGGFLLGLYIPTVQVDVAAHCMTALVMIERERLRVP